MEEKLTVSSFISAWRGIKSMEGLQRKTNCEITSRGSFTNKTDIVNGLKYFYLIFDVHQFGEERSCVSFLVAGF